ncbi:hypothetical protein [Streptomyces olivaceus]|uniref:hypothetical protein n=1 Tax=Streptomyces olivaceus TaxID=47716 RepID=UPI001884996A|nr:hypothetical protein [Streptomyces olivaceus]MBZ6136136.1 hypothetical protein [Streptomyces olivaceus]MBZ6163866.1 hypothetical protein [Streptomyces olivaceus]MBZ6170743.1 hypothetical protein [Streptomyces olivaceus]MBZ6177831.1 hypothetical protein [Streptomyces olivaceus]
MRKSSWGVGAALAVSVLCAAAAPAAAAHVPYSPRAPLAPPAPPAPHSPRDVTADACLRGGGLIVISADVADPDSFTQVCRGGVHDGQTVT